ncbi:DUF3267 domain-containing protein [Clostridium perfringens]|uniref:DUF3267 domain-containing protein n=2 Tax=Clostridium perfringens TaxID=1502 RepID=G5DSC6_CLOPF|nr:DUF3267 domain-containing protein [Clostridium perfringens]AEP94967.1 hypothetical protein pBeta2_00077 [Clostridium perfringens]AWS27205.1 hypothetical protein CYK96_16475 [Clostridium perfringens]MBO3304550.1 DUF3267 domain-containing protein [Clostridium perfringens]MBO3307872.1 DUF3267 domain-containing protein [Clostridium perfringens]MBO3311203.1 DUF3267 domain-containing protein [Clostridium perfringens]
MRYINSIPKKSSKQYNEMINQGWIPLKEPRNLILAIIISIPISILCIYLSLIPFYTLNNYFITILKNIIFSDHFVIDINLLYILIIYTYIFIHELIHLIFIPNFINSKCTFISLKFWGGFVYTEEKISKLRFLIVTIMPFIILSFIVPFLMMFLGLPKSLVLTLLIVNSAGSSVDILTFFLVLIQVPKNSNIKNLGARTFFK